MSENSYLQTGVEHQQTLSLREHLMQSLYRYFQYLESQQSGQAKGIILDEVESALYEACMKYTRGNQSRAARLLGVSRGTLRTKLKKYFSTTHVGLKNSIAG